MSKEISSQTTKRVTVVCSLGVAPLIPLTVGCGDRYWV